MITRLFLFNCWRLYPTNSAWRRFIFTRNLCLFTLIYVQFTSSSLLDTFFLFIIFSASMKHPQASIHILHPFWAYTYIYGSDFVWIFFLSFPETGLILNPFVFISLDFLHFLYLLGLIKQREPILAQLVSPWDFTDNCLLCGRKKVGIMKWSWTFSPLNQLIPSKERLLDSSWRY